MESQPKTLLKALLPIKKTGKRIEDCSRADIDMMIKRSQEIAEISVGQVVQEMAESRARLAVIQARQDLNKYLESRQPELTEHDLRVQDKAGHEEILEFVARKSVQEIAQVRERLNRENSEKVIDGEVILTQEDLDE